MEWITRPLGEITSYMAKGIPPKYTEEETENTVRVLNQKCNRNFTISYADSRIHDCTQKKVPGDKLLKKGDVLINSTGTGTAGRVAQMMEIPIPTTIDGHMILLRPSKEIDAFYYGYAVKAHQAQIETLAEGSTGQTEINRNRLQTEVMITYPEDKKVQAGIASFLRDVDRKIEVNNDVNRNLSRQARAIYNERFGALEKTKVLNDYPVRIYSGGTPSTTKKEYWENGDIHWLSSGETADEFVITTEKNITQLGVDKSSTKWARKYDVVTASAGQGHTRGQTTMILLDTCINQSVIVTHAEKVYMPFIFFNISGRYDELRVLSDGTSTRGSLTTKIMAKLGMPDISDEEIKSFSDYAWPIISQIEVNLKENNRLAELRDSLLPKLMSGELDVSDLEI